MQEIPYKGETRLMDARVKQLEQRISILENRMDYAYKSLDKAFDAMETTVINHTHTRENMEALFKGMQDLGAMVLTYTGSFQELEKSFSQLLKEVRQKSENEPGETITKIESTKKFNDELEGL